MTEEKKIPTLKLDPETLQKLNAQISGELPCTVPTGTSLFQALFKVGEGLRYLVAVRSRGPDLPADVEQSLFERVSEDEADGENEGFELVKELPPERYPVNRLYEIGYNWNIYQVRIESK